MILLLDVGNTHAHLGVGSVRRVAASQDLATADLGTPKAAEVVRDLLGGRRVIGSCYCSVVPKAVPDAILCLMSAVKTPPIALGPATIRGVGIQYPKPETIGADRLANAVAVRHHFGAPALVVDFGTAVTFDVVDVRGNYIGGVIAPGLAALTDYLHEKTALLPKVEIREPRRVVGRSTEEAMLVGAVWGYRGLVREILAQLKAELGSDTPVVATGGYARLIARRLPEIDFVRPNLTLEGLRLTYLAHQPEEGPPTAERSGRRL